MDSDYLDSADAASLLGTTDGYLARLRYLRRGPRYARHRGRIFYRRSDLLAHLRLSR